MANIRTTKNTNARSLNPLAIAGAVLALGLFFGFLWYRTLGPGVTTSEPTGPPKNVPPKESIPPEVRAMYEGKPGGGPAGAR